MINLGLTFSGGGGKGAYEIGVWKALKEFGIDQYIKAVSGTSVGALNAALFVNDDYEKAEKTWGKISDESILKPNPAQIGAFISSLAIPYAKPTGLFIQGALQKYSSTGLFKQDGLEKLIKESVDLAEVSNSALPISICAFNLNTNKPEYIKLNGEEPENISKYLLASAAIPVVFDKVVVKGVPYYDGGIPLVGDNTPVAPVIAEGCDMVIAVILNQGDEFGLRENQYENTKFWKIIPEENQGGLIDGTMDFNPQNAKNRISQGYEDTKKILQRFYEFMLIEQKYVKKAEIIKGQDYSFLQKVEENKLLREKIEQEKKQLREGQNFLQCLLETSKPNRPVRITSAESKDLLKTTEKNIAQALNESEKKLIEVNLEETIDAIKDNSTQITQLAFEGITALSPVKGRTKYLQEQGFLKRIWNGITGKNLKLIAESQNDLYKAVYVNQELIKKLAEKNLLTMDILISFGNKIEYLQNQLQQQNINMLYIFDALKNLQYSTSQLVEQLQHKFKNIDERFERLERGQEILFWKSNLNGKSLNGQSYSKLNSAQKVGLAVSELFLKTGGLAKEDYYYLLRSALIELGIEPEFKINLDNFFVELSAKSDFSDRFLENIHLNHNLLDIPDSIKNNFPLLQGVETAIKNPAESKADLERKINKQSLVPANTKINTLNFAAELLFSLYSVKQYKQRDGKKSLIKVLDECLEIDANDKSAKIFFERLTKLKDEINAFKVLVPLVGPFDAGKSSLLNAYLGQKLLPVDILAKTALAAELHYSNEEKLVVHYLKSKKEIKAVNELEQLETGSKDIFYLQLYLNNRRLQLNGDVVLVDMPGLDSTVEKHSKAIINYVNRGSYFILILNSKIQLENSVFRFLNELTLNKQNYEIILSRSNSLLEKERSEIKQSLSKYLKPGKQLGFVESKGKNTDIAAFIQTVDFVKEKKEDLIHAHFYKPVSAVLNEMKNYLSGLLKSDNRSVAEIQEEIDELENKIEETEKEIIKPIEELHYRLEGNAAEKVVDAVKNKLNGSISVLTAAAESGSSNLQAQITDLIRPVINSEIKKQVEKENERLTKRVNTLLSDAFNASVGAINLTIPEKSMTSTILGGTAAAAVFVFPVIGLLLGIAAFISSKSAKQKKKEDIRMQISGQIIPGVLSTVREKVKESMSKFADEIEKQIRAEVDQKKDALLKALNEQKNNKQKSEEAFKEKQEYWQESLQKINNIKFE